MPVQQAGFLVPRSSARPIIISCSFLCTLAPASGSGDRGSPGRRRGDPLAAPIRFPARHHDAAAAALSVRTFSANPERMLDSTHPRERMFRRRSGVPLRIFRRNGSWWGRMEGVRGAEDHLLNYRIRVSVVLEPEVWSRSLLAPADFDPDDCAAAVAEELYVSGTTISDFLLEDLTPLEITLRGATLEEIRPVDWHPAQRGAWIGWLVLRSWAE